MFKYFTLLIVILMWAATVGYVHFTKQHELTPFEFQTRVEYCNMVGGQLMYDLHPNGHVNLSCEGGLPAD
jgi:hypothetical protein